MKVSSCSVIFVLNIVIFCVAATIIIVEDAKACFRRVLAGKRVSRGFVKRALVCERLAECQEECAHEKRFTCEGFNYRLDPSGRGKGECELLEVPLQFLDIGRDIYTDRDYDYYERDRNAVRSNNCEGFYRRPGYQGTYLDPMPPRRYDPWPPGYNRRYDYERRPTSDDRYLPTPNRRGDFSYHQTQFPQLGYENTHNYHHTDRFDSFYHQPGIRYLPPKPSNRPNIQPPPFDYKTHDHKSQGSYLPPDRRYDKIPEDKRYGSRNPEQGWLPNSYRGGSYGGNYGSFGHHDVGHYRPHSDTRIPGTYKPDYQVPNKDWGQYGGTYGNGISGYEQGHYGHHTVQSWDVDTNKINYDHGSGYFYHKPQPQLPPILRKHDTYVPLPPKTELQIHITHEGPNIHNNGDNSLYPLEPRLPGYSHVKDECSLRSATGFKLHKGIVKKFYAVPNIYECELLCFKEKDFSCASYAYRYTIPLTTQTDNCYLSNKNYKELDYYTDLEPDRDFDIYTMNNMDKCRQPMITGRDNSDCFWRVRSGQRLDHRIVKDTLLVKSIVQCQIECLQSRRFTCRAFSFRYGSPVSGGAIDNCQLTDWPFYELDPRTNFMPEPGYEVYERGSYGHGCEPYHFDVRGKHDKNPALRVDQLCYVGFGSPARLLPQATKKSLRVNTELDCKAECSKFREGSLFECMSFSYRTVNPHHGINCYLSDILQRDLLPTVDYIQDPDSWLFAWDNFNPECTALADKPIHKPFLPDNHIGSGIGIGGRNGGIGIHSGLDTWRAYSVSGWPCRRGSLCQENREAGFWFCELEGGDANSWDYCCRPDHQCGYSEGFPYQWCYVGSVKTQWRKCSERYYPYVHNIIDRIDLSQQHRPYLPVHSLPPTHSWVAGDFGPPPLQYWPGIRPNRPPSPPTLPPPQPSLDDYEMQFDQHFLAPPKPGGFGQPRHWPVSYLHKEMPPNISDSDARLMQSIRNEDGSTKLNAIQSLINIIQSNDLQNVQYQITNQSNNMDDILYVKIPLPTNFTKDVKTEKMHTLKSSNIKLEPVNFNENVADNNTRRWSKSISVNLNTSQNTGMIADYKKNNISSVPIYRKSYITRTNITSHGAKSKI